MDALFSEELDLLLAVSLLVVLGAFADVLLTVLQHAIDQSGQPVDTVRVKTETVYSRRRETGVVMASTGPPVCLFPAVPRRDSSFLILNAFLEFIRLDLISFRPLKSLPTLASYGRRPGSFRRDASSC